MFSPADRRLPQDRACLPRHTGGYPSTRSLNHPPPHALLTALTDGHGGWEMADSSPSASCLTLGWGPADPCHDPETRKVCLLFFPGRASLPWPSAAVTSQPHQKTWPSDQQRLSCSGPAAGPASETGTGLGPGTLRLPSQAGLKARLPGAGVGTCPREPPGRGLPHCRPSSQAPARPSGASPRVCACVWV